MARCIVCGTLIVRKPSYWLRLHKGPPSCSLKCRGEYLKTKYLGNANPNARYTDGLISMADIDSEGKAYLLGWIASDGSIRKDGAIVIEIHEKDKNVLDQLKGIAGNGVIHKRPFAHMAKLVIYSKKMVLEICGHLGINPGKKNGIVKFPLHLPVGLQWAFLRGLFDGDGSIRLPSCDRTPECNITSSSPHMRAGVCLLSPSAHNDDKNGQVRWGVHPNTLDFLGKLYEGANFYLPRKRDLYLDWCCFTPVGTGHRKYCGKLLYNFTRPEALPLLKHHTSDSGYDIAIVTKVKELGDVTLYGTGIKIQPPEGYYFDLVPRSSIIKTGYSLANSVGVVDRTYVGEILVALRKMDPGAPDLPLPIRVVQLIPRSICHFEVQEVTELDDTERGAGGFGSTGK